MTPDGDPFGLSATARAFLAGVLDHLPALGRADLPVLPVLRPAAAQRVGRVHRLVGLRQPGGRAAHRVAVPGPRGREPQRRAEDVRREQQPAPRARRPDPRGPGRAHPRAHAARARRARPGAPRRGDRPAAAASGRCPPTRRPRSTPWRPTRSSWPGSATCWHAACSRPRRAEYARCTQMGDEAVRRVTFAVL
jgi:hypothetical protein